MDKISTMFVETTPEFQHACRIWFCPAHQKIAKELRELPQDQREKVWADLSANEDASHYKQEMFENPSTIDAALEQMKRNMHDIQNKPGCALSAALNQNRDYVEKRSTLLPFLRFCEYDPRMAVMKLADFMETKRTLFGDDVLGRDIELSDLGPDDLETLNGGGFQILEKPDLAGRQVMYLHPESMENSFKNYMNVARVYVYLQTITLRDEITQKHGIIILWDHMSEYIGGYDYEGHRFVLSIQSTVPVRISARYVLFKSNLWKQVLDVIHHFLPKGVRTRTRWIQGSHSEVMYALMCLGIPYKCIPTSRDGKIKLDYLQRWIEERKAEESRRNFSGAADDEPTSKRLRVV